jgi:hypothetical protein
VALEQEPRTTAALGRILAGEFATRPANPNGYAANPLAYAVRFLLPIVQVPPRGLWNVRTQPAPAWTTLEAWLGRPLPEAGSIDGLVLRYLAAFGPASPADARTWSWLTGLREVFERLRPQLVSFRDERGRELFDLPDAPRPSAETPAPPRFLPEYDNVALSHDGRSRILADSAVGRLTGWVGTFTSDGFVRGQWRVDRGTGSEPARLIVEPFEELTPDDGTALIAEGERLLAFHAPAAGRRVEFGVARERAPEGSPSIGGSRPRGG